MLGNLIWVQQVLFYLLVCFGDLALFISKYILFDVIEHIGLPVAPCDKFMGLDISWMTCQLMIMMVLDYLLLKSSRIWHICSFSPKYSLLFSFHSFSLFSTIPFTSFSISPSISSSSLHHISPLLILRISSALILRSICLLLSFFSWS